MRDTIPRGTPPGDVVTAALRAEGIDTIFGIVGSHVVGVYDALRRHPGIHRVSLRHEGTVSFAAAVWARLTGQVGVAIVTAGPGVLNALNGLAQAQFSGWPLLLLAGGPPRGASAFDLHGLVDEDYSRRTVAPLVKQAKRVEDIDALAELLAEAFFVARSGRPGPVYVEIPLDLFSAGTARPLGYAPQGLESGDCSTESINTARKLLSAATNPLVVIDRGAADGAARREALALAETSGAALVVTRDALGAVDTRHPRFLGTLHEHWFGDSAFRALMASDVCVVLGADEDSANRQRVRSQAAGAVHFLHAGGARDARCLEAGEVAPDAPALDADTGPGDSNVFVAALQAIAARLDEDSISVVDAGNHEVWARTLLPIRHRHHCIGGADWASMGFALPAAIAARVAFPGRRVLCVSGDGCLLMSLADLSTLFEAGGPTLLLLLNDSEYGMMTDVQNAQFGAACESALPRVDFVALARSLGGSGTRVDDGGRLDEAVASALESERPHVLEIVTERPDIAALRRAPVIRTSQH